MSDKKAAWRSFNYGKWEKKNKKFDHKTWNRLCDEGMDAAETAGEKWADVLCSSRKQAEKTCGGSPPFQPCAWYNATGDILEVYLSNEASYAKWLNHQVTVLLCQETNEVVGFQIWGMKHVEHIDELIKWIAKATSKIDSSELSTETQSKSEDQFVEEADVS